MTPDERYADRINRLTDDQRLQLYRLARRHLTEESPTESVRELIAFYTADDDPPAVADLRSRAQTRLPEYARPQRFVRIDKMPRTPNGKLDRAALAALVDSPSEATDHVVSTEPSSATTQLREAFRKVLKRSDVGADSNFFDLGGHSLLVIECILDIERTTGVRIPTATFFNHPTPAALTPFVVKAQATEGLTYLYPVNEHEHKPPIFVFSASRLAYALREGLTADMPIYGVNLHWLDENGRPIDYEDISDMARRMRAEIEAVAGDRPIVLAGSSFPGVVAYEVAQQLLKDGREPAVTMLFEPTPMSTSRNPIERDLDRLEMNERLERGHATLTWLRLHHPLTSRLWRRLYTFAVRIPRNKLLCRLAHRRAHRGHALSAHVLPMYTEWRANSLWSQYQPGPFAGQTVLVTSEQYHDRVASGWLRLLPDATPTYRFESSHDGLLRQPTMSRMVIPAIVEELESALAIGKLTSDWNGIESKS